MNFNPILWRRILVCLLQPPFTLVWVTYLRRIWQASQSNIFPRGNDPMENVSSTSNWIVLQRCMIQRPCELWDRFFPSAQCYMMVIFGYFIKVQLQPQWIQWKLKYASWEQNFNTQPFPLVLMKRTLDY